MSMMKLPFFLSLTTPIFSFHFPWEKEKRLFRPQFEFSRADNNYESVRVFYPASDRKKVYCDIKESFVTISISSTLLSEENSRTERKKSEFIIGLLKMSLYRKFLELIYRTG